jgi:hypothetical protein
MTLFALDRGDVRENLMSARLILALSAVMTVAASQAAVLTLWDFNFGGDANTGTGTTNPSIGTGVASAIGGVTTSFSSGDANGGSSDPNVGDDSGWQTTTYPAQGGGSGTAGVQFMVSTVGVQDITVSWDTRHSNTSSQYVQLQYTVDGTNFITTGLANDGVYSGNAGDTWFNQTSADLTTISGVNNNANFGFRIVTVFEPTTGAYKASNPTGTYAGTGTLRYDMVTVNATAAPEPGTMIALGMGALALLRRRRA